MSSISIKAAKEFAFAASKDNSLNSCNLRDKEVSINIEFPKLPFSKKELNNEDTGHIFLTAAIDIEFSEYTQCYIDILINKICEELEVKSQNILTLKHKKTLIIIIHYDTSENSMTYSMIETKSVLAEEVKNWWVSFPSLEKEENLNMFLALAEENKEETDNKDELKKLKLQLVKFDAMSINDFNWILETSGELHNCIKSEDDEEDEEDEETDSSDTNSGDEEENEEEEEFDEENVDLLKTIKSLIKEALDMPYSSRTCFSNKRALSICASKSEDVPKENFLAEHFTIDGVSNSIVKLIESRTEKDQKLTKLVVLDFNSDCGSSVRSIQLLNSLCIDKLVDYDESDKYVDIECAHESYIDQFEDPVNIRILKKVKSKLGPSAKEIKLKLSRTHDHVSVRYTLQNGDKRTVRFDTTIKRIKNSS